MANAIHRRDFLKLSAGAAATVALWGTTADLLAQSKPESKMKKAVQYAMLPKDLADADKFKLARKCGFEGIEVDANTERPQAAWTELGKIAKDQGTPIHSIVFGGWHAPMSDANPEVQAKGVEGMKKTLADAKAVGASSVLLVPAIVTETVSYGQAYQRSQENIRKLIPTATDLNVTIAVENVWNKFLLSPLEFARYVDEFANPIVRAYFDVGNVILFGFSQDWIRTLGKRLVRIHLKDFKRQGSQWTNLLDGDVNWKEVKKALEEVGYSGFLTPELGGGDEAYLTDLSKRIDRILQG
jgi:L-ribulose-5-phosphate 3-epimerase